MSSEQNTDRLFKVGNAFDYEGTSGLFLQSVREMFEYQCSHSPVFKGICEQYGFDVSQINDEESVSTFLPTASSFLEAVGRTTPCRLILWKCFRTGKPVFRN